MPRKRSSESIVTIRLVPLVVGRLSSSIPLINTLQDTGAKVRAYTLIFGDITCKLHGGDSRLR
jgi:hypothetical protein